MSAMLHMWESGSAACPQACCVAPCGWGRVEVQCEHRQLDTHTITIAPLYFRAGMWVGTECICDWGHVMCSANLLPCLHCLGCRALCPNLLLPFFMPLCSFPLSSLVRCCCCVLEGMQAILIQACGMWERQAGAPFPAPAPAVAGRGGGPPGLTAQPA